jgi:predicted alpha-1,6-mannanase (GH76 family)
MADMTGKKRILAVSASVVAVLIMVIAAMFLLRNPSGSDDGKWAARADLAQRELLDQFWDEKRKLHNNAAPCMLQLCTDPFHYWWQAHALDTLIDGYARTKEESYKQRIEAMYQGILDRNGVFPNAYYDDMEWMALAWLRAYDHLGDERYKQAALVLWEDILTGWNEEMGGGIAWRKEQLDYKNTPANAPAVILGARLYARFGDERDWEWARRIFEWQRKTLVDPETGLVWDGINRLGDGRIDKDWRFTYGQGVYIGAAVEMYRVTRDPSYLEEAWKTADYVLRHMTSPATGMLPSEGDGDGALFKGILVRYLLELIKEDPARADGLVQMLVTNGESLWEHGKHPEAALFSNSWAQTPDPVVQLSTQLSGMMLLEVLAVLEQMDTIDF